MTDFPSTRGSAPAAPGAGLPLPTARIALYAAIAGLFVWLPPLVLAVREWDKLVTHLHLGPDYISFYAASLLTLDGRPASVYDIATHNGAQKGLFPESGYSWFFYPPVYLLLCWPLALASYFVSLGAWLGTTLATYLAMARRFAPRVVGIAPFIAFPAVMMNATHGQNAFLTCSLLGAGVLCLPIRPVLAGALFGALAFKPQLGLLIPVLLAAGGYWRAFYAAAATVLTLCVASLAAFGPETWTAYFASLPEARRVLEHGAFGHEKFQSVFAMLRLAGASVEASYGVQAAVALAVAGLVAWTAGKTRDALGSGALMCAGAALATPFILRYDLMLLAIPLMWLAHDAQRRALRPHEAITAAAAFLLPLIPLDFTDATGLLVAPIVIGGLFALLLARVLAGAKQKGEPAGSPR